MYQIFSFLIILISSFGILFSSERVTYASTEVDYTIDRRDWRETRDRVPEDYYPNYKISGKREKLIDILETIEASSRVGNELSTAEFSELHQLFEIIFPYFPKSPSNNVVYKQCTLTTADLAKEVTSYGYTLFKDKCFTPVGRIVAEIQTMHTVKAEITANPQQGSAPLNVTLDARNSIDPSDDTIPSEFFFRYYKDVRGRERPIGKGPVVNYTFHEPGNHIVHLTVRSSNRQTEGVFDGEKSVAINVAPMAAQMVLYINGRKADPDRLLKIGMQDERALVSIDGGATKPMGAREIISHTWTITSSQGYTFKESNEGRPRQFEHLFPAQGIYKIVLDIEDNEGNRVSQSYNLSISDPVAIIKSTPEGGTTASSFIFDASASYSVNSKIRKYQWQIVDTQGNIANLVDAKSVKQQFVTPGTYTIKLTVTDMGGTSSTDTYDLVVGSTPPVPSFLITPTSDLKYPSRFLLDGSASIDEDSRQGGDRLTYLRTFSNPEQVTIENTEDDNKRLTVTFNQVGIYKARLTVTDLYGETKSIEKEIKVESTLRPEMVINPVVTPRDTEVSFFAKANKPIVFYEWDFGDEKKQQTSEAKITHTYTKAGIYTVKLRVVNQGKEENVLSRQVFIAQKDLPMSAWTIKSALGNLELTPTGTCDTGSGTIPAYIVDRYESLIIDASASRNLQGQNVNVLVSFHPKNDEIYNKSVLNYRFAELGCQWIDITVDDSGAGKSVNNRVRFEVENALPTMQNLTLSFPQSKSQEQVGIGLSTTSIADEGLYLDTSLSSIIVKTQVQGARDPDGTIAYFRRRYYPNNDDTRKEGFKITPTAITNVTFVIPKPGSPTEYSFVVEAVDNDGGKMTSEQLLGKGPVLFFPPGEVQLDQPIVSLHTNSVNAKAGDLVEFRVEANIPSERPDFEATRVIKYDFDGDGIYDQTTKKTEVLYSYQKPGTYKPKVAVYYRDRAGIGLAESLTIIKAVTPRLLYATHDQTVLVRDVSIGDRESFDICMDLSKCLGTGVQELSTGEVFVYTYPTVGEYISRIRIIDAYGNEQEKKDKLTITSQSGFGLLTIPEAIALPEGGYEISLGSNLKNILSVYATDTKRCYIDLDTSIDSNGDGDPMLDEDIICNQLFHQQLISTKKQRQGRIYRVENNQVKEEPLVITFLDIEEEFIPDAYVSVAKDIDILISHLPQTPTDTYQGYYKDNLINLKSSLGDGAQRSSLVVQLRDLVGTYPYIVPANDKEKLATLLTVLSDENIQAAYGGTIYDTARSNILSWLEEPAKTEVDLLFNQFESEQGNQSNMKAKLDAIAQRAYEEQNAGRIDEVDFNDIKKNLCDIIIYYELPSTTCGSQEDLSADDESDTSTTTKKTSTIGKILKVVLWIVIILAILFGIMIVIFAIKAKRQQGSLETPTPPTPSG